MRSKATTAIGLGALAALCGAIVYLVSFRSPPSPPRTCVYSAESITDLDHIGATVGKPIECAMVYANENPTWSDWERPWFLSATARDEQWARWLRAKPHRRLIVTLALVPQSAPADWRTLGAEGRYDPAIKRLARNLVASGLGRATLRLDPEANIQAGINSFGSTPAQVASWVQYWARFARALRSVPGAHFELDWTVNAGYRAVPFASYYPGNAAVDIIGVDAYDSLPDGQRIAASERRWRAISREPGGIDDLLSFARSHHKPMSVPEWGEVGPPAGGGDDSIYMAEMAKLFRRADVDYESYFDESDGGAEGTLRLAQVPRSLAVYRREIICTGG